MFNSLYIHVPFCQQKCEYCAFYSLPNNSLSLQKLWVDKIIKDLKIHSSQCGEIKSIFFGGGTPSLLFPEIWKQVFQAINSCLSLSNDCEISSECNPDSLTPEFLKAISTHVNRLSVGVQSFNAQHRQTIGRKADPENLAESLKLAHEYGINNINIDLIYSIPGQTVYDWEQDLRIAISLPISHLSAYSLTIEEGTKLAKGNIALPSEEEQLQMEDLTKKILADAGIYRYEISNYAKPNKYCRHNNDIWHGETYLGLGPSSSSFDGKIRFTQSHDFQRWLNGETSEIDELPEVDRAAEILAFGMRTIKGWNIQEFAEKTGFKPSEIRGEELQELVIDGLLEINEEYIQCTELGLQFNNHVIATLL